MLDIILGTIQEVILQNYYYRSIINIKMFIINIINRCHRKSSRLLKPHDELRITDWLRREIPTCATRNG